MLKCKKMLCLVSPAITWKMNGSIINIDLPSIKNFCWTLYMYRLKQKLYLELIESGNEEKRAKMAGLLIGASYTITF